MEWREPPEERLFREEVRGWLQSNRPRDERPGGTQAHAPYALHLAALLKSPCLYFGLQRCLDLVCVRGKTTRRRAHIDVVLELLLFFPLSFSQRSQFFIDHAPTSCAF